MIGLLCAHKNTMVRVIAFTVPITLFLVLQSTGLLASESRHHDAHVHGFGNMNVVLDGANLMIELKSPAANITGFEHAPDTEEQRHKVHESLELLESGDTLFLISPKAGCTLHEAHASTDMVIEQQGEDHGHHDEAHEHSHDHGDSEKVHDDHQDKSGHSDFEAMYHFECTSPDKLKAVDVQVFSSFPGFEEIAVQLLTQKKQTAVKLTPKSTEISF